MRSSLLLEAMLLLFGLVTAVPLPEFVTMVVTEIHTVVQRRRSSPKFLSTISSTVAPTITITSTTYPTASSIYSTSLDPYAEIMSLLALLTPPASLSSLTSTGAPGMAGVQALASYVEEIANSSWLATVAPSDFSYESSEARIAASIMPAIVSLGAVELTILLSEQAQVASSLGAAEGSLSSKVFTTISTAFGTETAVVTEPLLVPIVTQQKSRLAPGQKIGLGIGIPAFFLLALAIGFVIFHVRRNRIRSQEAAFLEVQPRERKNKHLHPQPEGSAIGLRSSGASFSNDNTAASTLVSDRPRPQSYYGATYDDSVENRRVQSVHDGLSRCNSTSRPLDVDGATHDNDAQASHALDLLCHAYGGLQSSEGEIHGHPTDSLHAILPIAHELPTTPLNTRLQSPVSQQHIQEGIPNGSNCHETGIQASMDTESEASMDNWREAVAESENAYDGDDDEAEHSEGIGRAT